MKDKELFIFDLEGVLVRDIDSGELMEYSKEILQLLKDRKKKIIVLSNVARKPRNDVYNKIKTLGINKEDVITAGYVASQILSGRCYVISEYGLFVDLKEGNIEFADENVDYVVIGPNRDVSYRQLNHAMRLILEGAKLVCVGASLTYKGRYCYDYGVFLGELALTKALEAATNTTAKVIGKPHPEIFNFILEREGISPNKAVMIGDNIVNDVQGAKKLGMTTVFIGGSTETDIKPDFRFDNIKGLYEFLLRVL